MYTAGELERASMALDKPMKELEERIMADIVRRIREAGEITSSADWQINRAVQLGMSMDDISAYINDALSEGENITDTLYNDVIKAGYVRDKKLYEAAGKIQIPFDKNLPLQQLISGVTAQTNETLVNITQSLGFAKRGIDGKIQFIELAKYYQQTLDKAVLDISSGAFDYNTVLKRTVSELTNSGLRTIDYATGWSNRVNVAARRAVMTGMTQLTGKVNEDNAEELETEWFEISWHSGARPSHWWGGKWYKKEQLVSICALGDVTGLCGANCYHSYTPVIPGISEPTYSPEELAELEKQEKEPIEWGNKKYTKYEALQRQRQLETTMRAQREEMMLLKEGGASEDDLINCRARYMVTSHQYTQFSKAMGLPQQRERVSIDGLGNIMLGNIKGGSGKKSPIDVPKVGAKVFDTVTAEERKELLSRNKININNSSIDNSAPNGIIKAESEAYAKTIEHLKSLHIESIDTKPLAYVPDETAIISRIGGGDETKGSCASLSFAYAGQKGSIDVLDFRGGRSCEFFSSTNNIREITKFNGVKSSEIKDTNDFKAATELLKTAEKGKEYVLVTGKHAAIVRKTETRFEYLELQSVKENGFKQLTTSELKKRFKCQKSHKVAGYSIETSNFIIDRESLSNSDEFKKILSYINTPTVKQMKGGKGYAK